MTKEREEKEKYRPLKVCLENEETKLKILQNLRKLKRYYIRITEDLTKNERDLIKEWNMRANERNNSLKDLNSKWRVRGSPRSGLYLKQIFCNKNGS